MSDSVLLYLNWLPTDVYTKMKLRAIGVKLEKFINAFQMRIFATRPSVNVIVGCNPTSFPPKPLTFYKMKKLKLHL